MSLAINTRPIFYDVLDFRIKQNDTLIGCIMSAVANDVHISGEADEGNDIVILHYQ